MASYDGPPPVEKEKKSTCPECGRWEVCNNEIIKCVWLFWYKVINVCYYCRFDRKPYWEEEYESKTIKES